MSKTAGVRPSYWGRPCWPTLPGRSRIWRLSMPIKDLLRAGWRVVGSWGHARNCSITMSNDGGQRLAVEFNDVVFGGAMHLSKLPKHGQVAIVQHRDYTEVAYKPDANYKGADSFSVLVQINNINKPYNVTVE